MNALRVSFYFGLATRLPHENHGMPAESRIALTRTFANLIHQSIPTPARVRRLTGPRDARMHPQAVPPTEAKSPPRGTAKKTGLQKALLLHEACKAVIERAHSRLSAHRAVVRWAQGSWPCLQDSDGSRRPSVKKMKQVSRLGNHTTCVRVRVRRNRIN